MSTCSCFYVGPLLFVCLFVCSDGRKDDGRTHGWLVGMNHLGRRHDDGAPKGLPAGTASESDTPEAKGGASLKWPQSGRWVVKREAAPLAQQLRPDSIPMAQQDRVADGQYKMEFAAPIVSKERNRSPCRRSRSLQGRAVRLPAAQQEALKDAQPESTDAAQQESTSSALSESEGAA